MKIHLTIIFLLFTTFLFAQVNLVQNPSFEDTTGVGCPDGVLQSTVPTGWSSYSISPDYFNACSPSIWYNSVPSNYWGYQGAATGNAYCGAWAFQTIQPNSREYIGRQLSIPTVVGQKYYARIEVNLAEISNSGSDKIGILLSTVSYNFTNPAPIRNFAHVYSTAIISDTLNWTTISGSFIADSAYQYIIIGNFFDDINTDTIITGAPHGYGYGSYFFIDDIYLGTDSLTSVEAYNTENTITVFPNPATDELTIDFALTDKSYFELFDMMGAKRKAVTLDCGTQTKRIDLTDIDSGLYFYSVVDRKGNRIKTGKLVVIK